MATAALKQESVRESTSETVLEIRDVSKWFGTVRAVHNISLEVRRGEVLTLLGPSGCGKTTTLRMVIGLERVSTGDIVYQGRLVDSATGRSYVPTHKRNMGMVFQSYAIWPHMTVFENVAYPLRVRHVPGPRVREAVGHVLEQVGLGGLEQRPATQLSGGQQQRVALARSLVFEPSILLLDEPFSNLDAKLREQMRAELKVLQRRLQITVLFVTHDQIEALSLSDRIAVMSAGQVEQAGAPQDLYHDPATPMVRDFLGRTVMLEGQVQSVNGQTTVSLANGVLMRCGGAEAGMAAGQACYVAVRPEQVEVRPGAPTGDGTNRLAGEIEALLFIGDRYEARIKIVDGPSVLVYLPPTERWAEGELVTMHLPADELRVWPSSAAPSTEETMGGDT